MQSAPTEVSAEVSNKTASSSSDSSDSEEMVEPTQVDSGQAASELKVPEPVEASSSASVSSKEHKQDDDEPKQVSDPRLNPKYVVV